MILVPSLLVMLAATTVEAKRAAGAAPIIDVDPDAWVQECATVFQETCCRSGTDFRSGFDSYYVNYSSYDVLKKPSGLCTVRTSTYGRHVSLRTNSMISLSLLDPRSIVLFCIIPISNTAYIYL